MSDQTPVRRTLGDLQVPADLAPLTAGWLLGYESPNTRRAYGRDLEAWFTFCTERDLDPLAARRAHVDAFARAMEQGWHPPRLRATLGGHSRPRPQPATVARRLAAVSSWYSWLAAEDVVLSSPAEHVRRPKVSEESATLGPDREEAGALLAAARDLGAQPTALVALLLLNGLRVSEAVQANVEDLGSERGHRVLRIQRKGGRQAVIPLADATSVAIDALVSGRHHGPIFLGHRGRQATTGRLSPAGAGHIVKTVTEHAGIDKRFSPHSLRHGFVTLSLEAGAVLTDVQDAAGHADPRTTRRYDRARHRLDHAPTYLLADSLAESTA